MHGPGWMLKRERGRRGWSPDELAAQLRRVARRLEVHHDDIDGAAVRRWEAGGGPLPFRHLRLIAATLDIPLTDLMGLTDGGRRSEWLVLVSGGTRLEAENAMLRREFLRYTAALAGASVTDQQRLVAALTDLGRVDHRLVADLEFLTAQYAGAMWTTPPGRLLPTLYGHLAILRRLMVGPVGEARQGLLQVQAAETAIVVGRLEWALERRDDAAQHWQLGARLASQAGDAALLAHATAMRAWSYSSVHGVAQDRDVPAALALLDNAIGFAPHTASYLLAWTLAERAHEHAAAGDAYASDRDLDAAARALGRARRPPEGYFGPWRSGNTELDSYRGAAALSLGRTAETVAILERTLSDTPDAHATQRASAMVDLAAAHLSGASPDVPQACALLSQAIALAHGAGRHDKVRRAISVRAQHLNSYAAELHVRELDDLIHSVRQDG